MPFEKVETQQVDFPALERAILEFWQRIEAFEKLRQKNQKGPRWSFLDGPITANNPMGVHHAWGRTYKDAFQRYHAMNGQQLRYQNGFDCQGLWVEVEVEKELKLQSKRDIENLVPGDTFASIDRFVQQCKARVDKYARVQTEQSIRLGYWMDWDRDEDWQKPADQRRSYFTMSEENNYTIWSFLKKCHGRGLVYRGYDAMPWCPRCSVGLSQMEMSEGYQLVAHRAVFVRFPLRGRPGENLLVWTTTPWTLSSNVAAAVNPALTYVKVLHKEQIYYVAKGALTAQRLEEQWKRKEWVAGVPKLSTLEQHFKSKGGYEIVGEVKGADMIGWQYDGPFDELPAQQGTASGGRGPPARGGGPATGGGAPPPPARPARCIASSPGKMWVRRKAPVSFTSRRAAARKTSSSARKRVCRRWRRSMNLASSCPASASWRASRPSIMPRPIGFSTTYSRKAYCWQWRNIRTAIRTAGAARRSCCSGSSMSGSST